MKGAINYSYNQDDSVNFITDARNVKTTFGYYPRGLVANITYDTTNATGVANTKNVAFAYDVAGNRTLMTETGQGTVNYSYDWLSRLTSEARFISDIPGPNNTFTFNYTYNQASQLKEMTNPFGSKVKYNYDAAGAVASVQGEGQNSAANYINSIAYKAFGGVKQINYGNTRQLSLQYNNRLFLTQWNLPTPSGVRKASNSLGYNYDYNKYGEGNTGRPDFADNLYDGTLDRAWTYDQVGRLIRAYTGAEANANWGTANGPYARGYDYDQYGNLTQQWGWGGPGRNVADNYNYTPTDKNQNPNHGYDLAGNMTNDGSQTLSYDATGQQASASMNAITMGYDGDGLRLKKVENGVTTYYLRSTVLGQQTVCEISSSGTWQRGYIYLGGQLLAIQDVPQNRVLWTHQEPYSKAQRITDSTGAVVSGVEVEPFGLETNRSSDTGAANQKRKFTTYDRDANGGDEAMFRRYAPKQNRFAQPDPYDGSYDLQNPQSLNRYAYVGGDPVSFVDPSGLKLRGFCQWYSWFEVNSDGSIGDEVGPAHLVCYFYDDGVGGGGVRPIYADLPGNGGTDLTPQNDPAKAKEKALTDCVIEQATRATKTYEREVDEARKNYNNQLTATGIVAVAAGGGIGYGVYGGFGGPAGAVATGVIGAIVSGGTGIYLAETALSNAIEKQQGLLSDNISNAFKDCAKETGVELQPAHNYVQANPRNRRRLGR